ncbi:hypothetical protein K2173_012633 [Erythroxylum novogranatense]|uniref:Glycosyltransferase n=1 Tax=Erythroxylum novogranatense TaxID=1862640 RepID=A0AAV8TLB5_9ROSI|nr:hypothetical protein K2173_012633 [Erythroxylum novogranatense]
MTSEDRRLHIFFLPFMAHGHMIPTMDMAKLFVSRGIKATIVTTPLNVPFVAKSIQKTQSLGLEIGIKVINFPTVEVGLPEGYETADAISSSQAQGIDMAVLIKKFFMATALLQGPVEKLLQEARPDCLIADMFFPWATDSATKFGIPRLVFHGTGFFALCTAECIRLYEPQKKVSSDSEPFVVPNLPGDITFTRKQMLGHQNGDGNDDMVKLINTVKESELTSYGVIVNSVYELEQTYADHYGKVLGRRAWPIGPLSLCNREMEDKVQRGKEAAISEHECMKWLDSKKPNSVIYVCFGTITNFKASQLKELALGLEASGQSFIWVVRKDQSINQKEEEDWLPEGFENRMEGKGLIVRGWAPQVLILDHDAIGAFVTHCGWNSTLEGITAAKPMVTWPLFADQFYNEKLVTEVLKIGVPVGVKQWVRIYGDFVEREAIKKAVTRVMLGSEAEAMRSRVEEYGEMVRKAVEEGGSSDSNLKALIQELKDRRAI